MVEISTDRPPFELQGWQAVLIIRCGCGHRLVVELLQPKTCACGCTYHVASAHLRGLSFSPAEIGWGIIHTERPTPSGNGGAS